MRMYYFLLPVEGGCLYGLSDAVAFFHSNELGDKSLLIMTRLKFNGWMYLSLSNIIFLLALVSRTIFNGLVLSGASCLV